MRRQTLAEALLAEMAQRHMSQSDVARELDVGPTRVNRWIKGGEPEPDAFDKLVKFLHLDGWDALGGLVLASKAAQFKDRPTRRA
jgi:transcriptional regulator with XRE-family HTH domain